MGEIEWENGEERDVRQAGSQLGKDVTKVAMDTGLITRVKSQVTCCLARA